MYEHPSEWTVRHPSSASRVLLHNPRFVRMSWMSRHPIWGSTHLSSCPGGS
jgi:hypothetical protein